MAWYLYNKAMKLFPQFRSVARIAIVAVAFLATQTLTVLTAEIHVDIPYQAPRNDGEWSGGCFEYEVNSGRRYQFVLEVERAPWDSVGIAGPVPIFLGVEQPQS